ncbi:MAG: hypothetical protein HGJ94_20820 [Desulfosarcina sp.]|nr:hypothetical protein [Desulfosarcina sp.]
MKMPNRSVRLTDHMMLIGFSLALVYWILDSILSIFTSYDNLFDNTPSMNGKKRKPSSNVMPPPVNAFSGCSHRILPNGSFPAN